MQVFIPFSEELLERHPELADRLVPYRPGLPCVHREYSLEQADPAPDADGSELLPADAA